jgi:AraC-like DNA-binding protein
MVRHPGRCVLNRCDHRAAPAHTPGPPAAPAARLRTIASGREALAPGRGEARHRHLEPYAIAVLAGQFDQVSYAGRVRVSAGELLVQPTLDAHANRMPSARGAQILRLPWPDVDGLGGVYPLRDLDAIVRGAERDPRGAAALAREQCADAPAPRRPIRDLPDLLAAHLVEGAVTSFAAWADAAGVARETASRAFVAAFGIPARQFRVELRVRAAWLRIVRTRDRLAEIAAATGFADQAHMTRQVCALTGASPSAWRRDPRTHAFYRGRAWT